jgi:hypothetical protein
LHESGKSICSKWLACFPEIHELALSTSTLVDICISSTLVIESIIKTAMSLMLRALVRASKPTSPLMAMRSFSVYHAIQISTKKYARLRREDSVAIRRLLDNNARRKERWRQKGNNLGKVRERNRLYERAHKGKERRRFHKYTSFYHAARDQVDVLPLKVKDRIEQGHMSRDLE